MSALGEKPIVFHAMRDPLKCIPGRNEHEFKGWREIHEGRGGEAFCKHCGVGALACTLAEDWG